ncbi:MAG: Eco29kI family restriction endonuclease [Candidatus Hydrogenedentes bacterium]|nr:Eco29kI family restriction endonuclease [Candidatus Hydrogenedentota bacterium]
MADPYNPLDKLNLGRSVAEALLTQSVSPLAQVGDLIGAGVYAIYYVGGFEAYAPIAEKNRNEGFEQPIYVGKAVPKGARKGGLAFDASKGRALRDRLRQHATSIDEAKNLELADFHFRSLVVDDIWIPLGENMLIEEFKPVWNLVIDGFGNKDPGRRRATQYRSPWDVLHPGRQFAEKLAGGGTTAEMLTKRLREYFAGHVVPLVPAGPAADIGITEDGEE